MKESFIIEIDVEGALTDKECRSVMIALQARLQGYHCNFTKFINGDMHLTHIEHSEKRVDKINKILNDEL
jgi:hypothetical protein